MGAADRGLGAVGPHEPVGRFARDPVDLSVVKTPALTHGAALSTGPNLMNNPEVPQAAKFFDRVRNLTAEGFYTTDEGMKDIGYVGNVALPKFDGPPPEVLKHLGLA